MRIDRKLNLIVPLEWEGRQIYVHSTPISRVVFEDYAVVMAMAHAEIFKRGMEFVTGPAMAAIMIKKVAQQQNVWAGPGGVENGLMAEIRRLSWVIMPGASGWTTVPLDTACDQDMLSEDQFHETMAAICFFMLVSALNNSTQRPKFLLAMAGFFKTQTTLLNSTEFGNSLPTSTETGNSDPKTPESSATS